MLASEACPFCRNRIEGKPSPTIVFTGMSPGKRLPEVPTPRWSFECRPCQYEWLAEAVSPSLVEARL
jgi:hypothetical protein